MLFDFTRTWSEAEKRLADETDPRRRQILTTMVAHMKAERAGDFGALMATVSPSAAYHQWGSSPVEAGPKGYAGVESFYKALLDNDCGRVVHDCERMTVDRDSIVVEGELRMAYPGRVLAARGAAIDDPDAYYLYRSRAAIVWTFDDAGLVVSEDSYTTGDGFADMRKLSPDEVGA